MFRFSSVCLVVVLAVAGAGCKMLTAPSDVDWPGGDAWGEKPVAVKQTVTTSSGPSGSVTIVIEKMTPHEDGSARVGQKAQIWTSVTNGSDKYLAIRKRVSDGPNDNDPGGPGRPSNLFGGCCGVESLKPGETKEIIFGFHVTTPETIPYLRLSGTYGSPLGDFTPGSWKNLPEWIVDIHLGWTLTP